MQPKLKGAYDINLVPVSITKSQKAFRLAWHGWLAAALILVSIVFFFTSIVLTAVETHTVREALSQNQVKLAELVTYKAQKDSLMADIGRYENAMRVYNSIALGTDRWSRILHFLANTVRDINSIWIYSIRSDQGNPSTFTISGRAFFRSRVSSLVNIFERASLLKVRTVSVQNRELHEFDIHVEKIDKEDVPYVPPKATKK